MTQTVTWGMLIRLFFHFRHEFHEPTSEGLDTDYCIAVPGCKAKRPEPHETPIGGHVHVGKQGLGGHGHVCPGGALGNGSPEIVLRIPFSSVRDANTAMRALIKEAHPASLLKHVPESGHILGPKLRDDLHDGDEVRALFVDGRFLIEAHEWNTTPESQHVTVGMSRDKFEAFTESCQALLEEAPE